MPARSPALKTAVSLGDLIEGDPLGDTLTDGTDGQKELRFAEIPAKSRHRYAGGRLCYMEAGQVDLIAWNAPGYPLSDNLRAETPSCRDYADALDDLVSALGIGRFDIVANSFGTRVAAVD